MGIVADVIGVVANPVANLLSEFIEDKDKANDIAFKVSTMAATQAHEQIMGQLEVNKAEAQSGSLWNGGWRPFIGWICGFALLNNFILIPILGPTLIAYTSVHLTLVDLSVMMPILIGMLGLGGMRTYEKISGVAKK